MFDKNKFKGLVITAGFSIPKVAEIINVNTATLYRKMSGKSDFTRNEIQALCELLHIENPKEIFFA